MISRYSLIGQNTANPSGKRTKSWYHGEKGEVVQVRILMTAQNLYYRMITGETNTTSVKLTELKTGTFGSVEKYPCLKGMVEELNKLSYKERRKVTRFISHFDNVLRMTKNMPKNKFKRHILNLIRTDIKTRMDEQFDNFSGKTFVMNFIHAKINQK